MIFYNFMEIKEGESLPALSIMLFQDTGIADHDNLRAVLDNLSITL